MYSFIRWVLVIYVCLTKGEGVGGETNAMFVRVLWKSSVI